LDVKDCFPPRKYRLAVVATHPIQYQAPLWRAVNASAEVDLKVFFASRHGLEPSLDPGFGKSFAWDIPLVEGYDHEFLLSRHVPGLNGPVADRFPIGLGRRLSEGRFDAVLVHGYATAAAWAGMLSAWRLGLPLIMRGDTHDHGRAMTSRRRLKDLLLPRLLEAVDGFLAIGTWNREYWLSHGVPPERIETAVYAVDNDYFASASEKCAEKAKALRAAWGVPDDGTVFLYCAKFISVKAPEVLLKAFAALSEFRAHLVFVGSGEMEPGLQRLQRELAAERVHWEGFVNQSALPAYYRASDVLVLPSRHEQWGLVVNEAMACGTPCIVSDVVGAAPDMVEGKDTGAVFPVDDWRQLAAVMRAACGKDLRERWRRNIPAALSVANYRQNVAAIVSLLRKVVRVRPAEGRALRLGGLVS